VVRNTLESLVAKGQVQRHKQQRTVMYTLTDDARSGVPAEEGDAEATRS
jgi:DNA-binding transcriptional regulator PaaX